MTISGDFGVWIAALLTLCVFSFLYKDNPLYKFAEHLFVGVSAGYYIALNYWTVVDQYLVVPLRATFDGSLPGGPFDARMQDYRAWLIIPAVLGVLLFTRLFTRLSWMSRWSLAVVMGVYAGLKTTGFAQGDLVAQVQASLIPLWIPGNLWASLNAILFTIGLVTSLLFFFYSREHKGVLGGVSRVGVWFLMISFGAGYGYTVMSRVSLLIGRFQFLLVDWLHVR
ncbi:MAG: hypothetical protein IPJ04_10920 [Candidatus Eisenbacteria bacterium]|nr:hypothetical protein [Candidatus Eisenbacteria bacterium]